MPVKKEDIQNILSSNKNKKHQRRRWNKYEDRYLSKEERADYLLKLIGIRRLMGFGCHEKIVSIEDLRGYLIKAGFGEIDILKLYYLNGSKEHDIHFTKVKNKGGETAYKVSFPRDD